MSLALVLGCIVTFSQPIQAALLFSNNGQATGGTNRIINTTDRVASDFTTGASPTLAQSITVTVFNNNLDNNFTPHTFTASIFTDNAGIPGALVGSFSAFNINAAQSIQTGFGTSPGIALTPSTTYWEVLQVNENASTNFAGPIRTTSQSADGGSLFSIVPGTQVKFSSNSGSNWSDLFVGNSMFRLDGLVNVPEPSTYLLTVLSAMASLVSRRKDRA
jgi:hypothetical protein